MQSSPSNSLSSTVYPTNFPDGICKFNKIILMVLEACYMLLDSMSAFSDSPVAKSRIRNIGYRASKLLGKQLK